MAILLNNMHVSSKWHIITYVFNVGIFIFTVLVQLSDEAVPGSKHSNLQISTELLN